MKSEYHKDYYSDSVYVEWWGGYDDVTKTCHLHRVDGPAWITYIKNSTKEHYYLLTYEVSKEKFETPGFVDAFILEHS